MRGKWRAQTRLWPESICLARSDEGPAHETPRPFEDVDDSCAAPLDRRNKLVPTCECPLGAYNFDSLRTYECAGNLGARHYFIMVDRNPQRLGGFQSLCGFQLLLRCHICSPFVSGPSDRTASQTARSDPQCSSGLSAGLDLAAKANEVPQQSASSEGLY